MIKRNMTEGRFAASKLYKDVLKACEEHLGLFGQFNKSAIMIQCDNEALVDEMRWDWIIKKIEGGKSMPGGKVELISVAESFFKARGKEKAQWLTDTSSDAGFAGKYVAHGYGKRTAGWVLATYAEGRFALYKANLTAKNINGRKRHNEDLGKSVTDKLIATGETGRVADIVKITGIPKPRIT